MLLPHFEPGGACTESLIIISATSALPPRACFFEPSAPASGLVSSRVLSAHSCVAFSMSSGSYAEPRCSVFLSQHASRKGLKQSPRKEVGTAFVLGRGVTGVDVRLQLGIAMRETKFPMFRCNGPFPKRTPLPYSLLNFSSRAVRHVAFLLSTGASRERKGRPLNRR